ncbi:hypothetical protein SUGI_0439430, partial [Cryptomeria japonica]
MVEKLLSDRAISRQERNKYVGIPDVLDQTPLHKAASGGHKLLKEGAHDPIDQTFKRTRLLLAFDTQVPLLLAQTRKQIEHVIELGETMKPLAESEAKQERAYSISETVPTRISKNGTAKSAK